MIQPWLIYVSHSAQNENVYGAYSDGDPIEKLSNETIMTLADENFNEFSFHDSGEPDPEDYDSEEEYDEAYQEWYNEYCDDVNFSAVVDEYNEIEEYEIVYDERENS